MARSTPPPVRPRIPRHLAVIEPDNCTGCEACLAVCPVDCIEVRTWGGYLPGTQAWCEVDWERCVGCGLCVRLPRRSSHAYEVLVCPWEAIDLVAPAHLPQVVAELGGPAEYGAEHHPRLRAIAERLAAASGAAAALAHAGERRA